MKAVFLVAIDTDSDTDLLGIATELKETLDQHFEYHTDSVKPYAHPTLGVLPNAGAAFAPPPPSI